LLKLEHIIWQPAGRGLLREASTIRWAPVVEGDIEEGTVHVQPAGVVNEAHLAEPTHEETDAGARGANHLDERFLADLGMTVSGLPSCPKWAINSSTRANRFSLELKS
jgi:hypothetical protein